MATNIDVRRLTLAGAALLSALLLSGCASGSGPIEDYPGLPVVEEETDEGADVESEDESGAEGEDEPEEEVAVPTGDEPFVIYLNDGGRLAITLWGSSTCPVVPTELRVTAEAGEGNAVEAILPEPPDGPCTMDFAPHTTVFSTPADVTTTEPLEVTIGDQTVTVPIK